MKIASLTHLVGTSIILLDS